MVDISLANLVRLSGSREYWPETFNGLVAALSESPEDIVCLAALADYLDERCETEMSVAVKYLMKRAAKLVWSKRDHYHDEAWSISGIPASITCNYHNITMAKSELKIENLAIVIAQLGTAIFETRRQTEA